MSVSFELRPAQADDREAMGRMRVAAGAGDAEPQEQWFMRWLTRQQRDERWGNLLVAECGSNVVGYGLTAWWSPDLVPDAPTNVCPAGYYLMGLWVDASARRFGIGKALAQARLRFVRERAPCAWYWTGRDNAASIALHAALGFEHYTDDFWFPTQPTESALYRLQWPDRAGVCLAPPTPEPER